MYNIKLCSICQHFVTFFKKLFYLFETETAREKHEQGVGAGEGEA